MKHFLLFAALSTLVFSACTEEKPEDPKLNIQSTYSEGTYWQDVTEEVVLRVSLNSLVSEVKAGRIDTNKLSRATLESIYTSMNPTLASRTTTYYTSLLMGSDAWFDEIERASGNKYTPGAPVGEGGVYGGYLFDENGLELEQMIEKGLFGAMNYYQASTLLETPTVANLNRALYLFGAHPSFPNTPTASKTQYPDVQMANYAARRSDINNANSLYNQIRNAFITAQSAMNQGFNSDRDAALTQIKHTWEKINAATIINYCHSVISTMSNTSPTDAQKASALHAYGECVGFTHGWRQIPADNKIITDSQIDEVLTLLLAAPQQTPESFKFITEPATQLPRLQQVITLLQGIYNFSNAEIESFKTNWVTTQNR